MHETIYLLRPLPWHYPPPQLAVRVLDAHEGGEGAVEVLGVGGDQGEVERAVGGGDQGVGLYAGDLKR